MEQNSIQTVVKTDTGGRIRLPINVRRALGINNRAGHLLKIELAVLKNDEYVVEIDYPESGQNDS